MVGGAIHTRYAGLPLSLPCPFLSQLNDRRPMLPLLVPLARLLTALVLSPSTERLPVLFPADRRPVLCPTERRPVLGKGVALLRAEGAALWPCRREEARDELVRALVDTCGRFCPSMLGRRNRSRPCGDTEGEKVRLRQHWMKQAFWGGELGCYDCVCVHVTSCIYTSDF